MNIEGVKCEFCPYKKGIYYDKDLEMLQKVADDNEFNVKDVLSELIQYGLDKLVEEYGWEVK